MNENLKNLEIVMYGTHHQRIIGEVDQAYEELKQSLNRLEMFEKLFCKLDFILETDSILETLEKEEK